jgi:hypothetical protein
MYASGKGGMYTMYTHLRSIHFSAQEPLYPHTYSMVNTVKFFVCEQSPCITLWSMWDPYLSATAGSSLSNSKMYIL